MGHFVVIEFAFWLGKSFLNMAIGRVTLDIYKAVILYNELCAYLIYDDSNLNEIANIN